jgi:peptidoglycan/xylan/chitin deacetylase (PgdA/CDA1 family)
VISRRDLLMAMAAAPARSVAITIDDLPRGGDWPTASTFAGLMALDRDFLAPFRARQIPLTGFVNSGRRGLAPPQMDRVLRLWLAAGAELGNHTHTHPDLNTTPLDDYRADILECDKALKRVVTKPPRYFRHPFLHAGPDRAKREGLEQFLDGHGCKVAPVTLDNSDYMFATAYSHALARRGYPIAALGEALGDPAYESRGAYYGPGGFSWIHRWSKTLGMPPRGEPGEPTFIRDEFARTQRR